MKRSVVFLCVALSVHAPACVRRADGTADIAASVRRASTATCAAIPPGAAIAGTVAAAVAAESEASGDSPERWITRGAALAAALCGAVLAMLHAPKVETPSADASAPADAALPTD